VLEVRKPQPQPVRQIIPAGKQAEYYSFYEISDKGTSWFGPLLFAWSTS